jgi:nucleotide-binding universal stress UspA family protein
VPAGPTSQPLRRAVLGLGGNPVDLLVIDFGCKLARTDRTQLVAVYVVEVDWRHGLDDELGREREKASRTLDVAEGIAEREKVLLETQLLQARDVGAALVDEAVALEADVIVLGLPYKVRFGGDFAIGEVIPYVFKNSPCRVLVIREPVADSEARDGDIKRS